MVKWNKRALDVTLYLGVKNVTEWDVECWSRYYSGLTSNAKFHGEGLLWYVKWLEQLKNRGDDLTNEYSVAYVIGRIHNMQNLRFVDHLGSVS